MASEADEDGLEIELTAAAPEEALSHTSEETGTPVGEPAGSPVVLVDGPVLEWMEQYARGDTDRERGGMLLGRLFQRDGEARVTVEAAVEAVGAEERRASITFTHETWEHINAVKEAQYPQLRIVGWFHTHPGYGVFLSGYDLFIQRNFFNLPWQVAFVIDPVHNDRGFFGWRGEDIARLPGYYVRGAVPVAGEAPAAQEVLEVKVPRRRPVLAWGAAAVAVVLAVGGGLILTHPARQRPIRPGSPIVRGGDSGTAPELPRAERGRRKEPGNSGAVPQSPKAPAPTPPDKGKTAPAQYVKMQAGDTLWEMSRRYLGTPLHYGKLQELNGIRDPKRIAAGTIIAVPAGEESRVEESRSRTGHGLGTTDEHR